MTITPTFSCGGGGTPQNIAEWGLFLSLLSCDNGPPSQMSYLFREGNWVTNYFSKKVHFKIIKKVHLSSFFWWGGSPLSASLPLHRGHSLAGSSSRKSLSAGEYLFDLLVPSQQNSWVLWLGNMPLPCNCLPEVCCVVAYLYCFQACFSHCTLLS